LPQSGNRKAKHQRILRNYDVALRNAGNELPSDSLFYVACSATQLAFGGLESCGGSGSNLMAISRP
jgi:hypothetical protein